MEQTQLLNLVRENLKNAMENGSQFDNWTSAMIAIDMMECGSVGDAEYEDIVKAIKRVREN